MARQTEEWEVAYRKTRRNHSTREHRIRLFELDPGQSILDYGCGDGLDLRIFRELGYEKVYGFDNSLGLLADARGFKVILADAYSLPLAPQSLDVVFINGVLHHLNDVERALSEIVRILVPGGWLCLIEPTSSPLRWLANRLTLSPFAQFSSFLSFRKRMLMEELPLQRRWLALEKRFPSLLGKYGLEVLLLKRTPFSVFIKACFKGFSP